MSDSKPQNVIRKFKLKAQNSSGTQYLYIQPNVDDNKVGITLVGQYEENPIQIDFDVLDRDQFRESLKMLLKDLEADHE